MNEIEFYGSVTVGERGQISLPTNLRSKYKIKAGDKILVLGKEEFGSWGIFLVKAEVLSRILEEFGEKIGKILEEEK
ncbi:AbrB family transcriptional regulator [Thermoplasmatales archaeon ex4484_30]|nr:MAG: AbrB family transcriptional regulator [Thermoplasmatales archaeon ex4484_30]